ncbi:activating signal cointegrator 1 complex subunit 2 isoform X2 [Megachile rotundata]|uniref:activating signal cointegrator 1 complex subunit 2 isoform X2 n=1 Tax=Megachile rotundata TaxID=143995 RepID=UPI0006153684|nr:PREDICTED: activating signal cointegrator 1 complex subunit 2 isoform X2 [Megachile rotundata]
MTENELHANMEPYKSKRWASDRYFLHYEAPIIYDDDGSEIVGAKEHWINVVNYIINDLKWLLSLPFYKFWSNIVYNTSVMNSLVSFLQEAPPFYALENFPNYPEMLKLLETLHCYVLMIFARLVTNKQSHEEYMSCPFLGNLLYENYIFTVPIILDLCQLYGRENDKVIRKILNCLFTLEPRYNNDLQKAVPCFIEALENVERKFGNSSIEYNNEAVSLSKRNTHPPKLTLFNLEDLTLYVLDISSTVTVFLKNYPPAVGIFHKKDFMNKIVSMYGSTIPEMYKTMDKLAYNEENMPKYVELKLRLDVTRIELINLYRVIIYEPILDIQENVNTITETEVHKRVDDYCILLNDAISEKEFITDYDRFYPVQVDLETLSTIYPEFDEMYKYTLNSVNVVIGKSATSSVTFSNSVNEAVAGPSGVSKQAITSANTNSSNEKRVSMKKDSIQIVTLVSEVKDILCDLDERFIEMCLDYYNYDTASVINAVLEDSLPSKLKEWKDLTPPMPNSIYDDTTVNNDLASEIKDLRVYDNYDYDDGDNVHVKISEVVEVPKEYIIRNYSLALDEYDDEYDDTYDNRDIRGNAQDDSIEIDSRPFTTPRVLLGKKKVETIEESESEDEEVTMENGKDDFIQNPEEVRAKAEQRRQAMRGGKHAFNVTGKPKGKGQDKDVLYNRQQKNAHKSTGANHNRRSGAQWKRNHGMIPS